MEAEKQKIVHPKKEKKKINFAEISHRITPEEYKKLNFTILGNYFQRNKQGQYNDARLKCLKSEYFTNKNVLEIGSNDGKVSIQIAIRFFPQKIIGIDIDHSLINHANANIKKILIKNQGAYSNEESSKEYLKKIQDLPSYFKEIINNKLKKQLAFNQKMNIPIGNLSISNQFPKNIEFKTNNVYLLEEIQKYDTLVCFSMTKWIHLAFGDEAIKQLFEKCYALLKQNGFFIIEFQGWPSYEKKKSMNSLYRKNIDEITMSPNTFHTYLINLGFELIEEIQEAAQALDHSICVFKKIGSSK